METLMKYRGFIIETETEPWALKYGHNVRYYKEGQESYNHASDRDEAMDEIDERTRGNDDEPEFDAEWEREKRAREY